MGRKVKIKDSVKKIKNTKEFNCSISNEQSDHQLCVKVNHDQKLLNENSLDSEISMEVEDTGDEPQEFQCSTCKTKFSSKYDLEIHRVVEHMKLKKNFPCSLCGEKFNQKGQLKIHLKRHFKIKEFNCSFCDAKFTTSWGLTCHIPKHTKEKPFECKICSTKFSVKSSLTTHLTQIHGTDTFSCVQCNREFKNIKSLTAHIKYHHDPPEKLFSCQLCPMKFHVESLLYTHVLSHTGENPYKCDQCSSAFRIKQALKTHILYVHREKELSCEICERKFAVQNVYKLHLKRHTEEGTLECDICHKKFYTASILKRHKKTHSEDRPYACTKCDKKYKRPEALTTHMKSHNDIKPYPCEYIGCTKEYRQNGDLQHHKRRIHGETDPNKKITELKCDYCERTFLKPSHKKVHESSAHLKDQEFPCSICSKIYYGRDYLLRHTRRMHPSHSTQI